MEQQHTGLRRIFRATAALSLATLWLANVALGGVHDGGVGSCSFCHVMHGSEDLGGGVGALLNDGSPSDICLNCHAQQYGAVLGDDPLNPPPERGPGNFVFLTEINLNDGPDGITNPISGDAAGHNINAPGHGLSADGTLLTSPGGSYPSFQLKCTSCHDPHGNQNYRFLRGTDPNQGSDDYLFTYDAPVAEGLDLVMGAPESNTNHVAYISGVSQWCGNCHQAYLTQRHQVLSNQFSHTTDGLLKGGAVMWYDYYNGTADPRGGLPSTSYLAEVPFSDLTSTTGRTAGPSVSSRMVCLTCHRAHATSAPHAGRWDFNVSTLGADGLISGSYPLPNPYPDPAQQTLCYKCHRNIPGN